MRVCLQLPTKRPFFSSLCCLTNFGAFSPSAAHISSSHKWQWALLAMVFCPTWTAKSLCQRKCLKWEWDHAPVLSLDGVLTIWLPFMIWLLCWGDEGAAIFQLKLGSYPFNLQVMTDNRRNQIFTFPDWDAFLYCHLL